MSRRCELTGVGPMVGHNVSHSNIKTKRRFLPALAETALQSEALGQSFRLKVTNATLRTLDFKGGLDAYLPDAHLGPTQATLRGSRTRLPPVTKGTLQEIPQNHGKSDKAH